MDSETADDNEEATRLVLQDKYSETGDSRWSCSLCHIAGQSSEDLITHLKSQEHAYSVSKHLSASTYILYQCICHYLAQFLE